MIKDAAIVMILGMGTVFLVLLVLLGLMTLCGRLAARWSRSRTATPAPEPVSSAELDAESAERDSQRRFTVAAEPRHCSEQERSVSK